MARTIGVFRLLTPIWFTGGKIIAENQSVNLTRWTRLIGKCWSIYYRQAPPPGPFCRRQPPSATGWAVR